jgi:hypothetical protein
MVALARNFGRWLDLDLASEATKTGNFTGCNPNEAPPGTFRGMFEDRFAADIYGRDQWKSIIEQKDTEHTWLTELINRVFNQKQEASCVSNAGAGCHEDDQALQFGPDRVIHVSAMSTYHFTGSSPNSGSNLDDCLNQMRTVGILPNDSEENKSRFKHTHVDVGYYTKLPQGFEETAALFKVDESYDIGTIEGIFTAVAKGYSVMYARAGHCIRLVRIFWDGTKFIFGYLNSWGQWGDVLNEQISYGIGYDSDRTMQSACRGAICFRSSRSPMAAGAQPAIAI